MGSKAATKERAHKLSSDVRHGAVGTVEKARDVIAPRVGSAAEALGPKVESARDAVKPAIDTAVSALVPALTAAMQEGRRTGRKAMKEAGLRTRKQRKEARKRVSEAASALQGRRSHRLRWTLMALAVGGAVGIALARRRRSGPVAETAGPASDVNEQAFLDVTDRNMTERVEAWPGGRIDG